MGPNWPRPDALIFIQLERGLGSTTTREHSRALGALTPVSPGSWRAFRRTRGGGLPCQHPRRANARSEAQKEPLARIDRGLGNCPQTDTFRTTDLRQRGLRLVVLVDLGRVPELAVLPLHVGVEPLGVVEPQRIRADELDHVVQVAGAMRRRHAAGELQLQQYR